MERGRTAELVTLLPPAAARRASFSPHPHAVQHLLTCASTAAAAGVLLPPAQAPRAGSLHGTPCCPCLLCCLSRLSSMHLLRTVACAAPLMPPPAPNASTLQPACASTFAPAIWSACICQLRPCSSKSCLCLLHSCSSRLPLQVSTIDYATQSAVKTLASAHMLACASTPALAGCPACG